MALSWPRQIKNAGYKKDGILRLATQEEKTHSGDKRSILWPGRPCSTLKTWVKIFILILSLAKMNDKNLSESVASNITNETNYVKPHSTSLSLYYPIIATEMGISISCLILLIIVYVRLQEHHTVPGKNVISLSSCLMVSYAFLIFDLCLRGQIPQVPCFVISTIIHFTFLASFFWTNVMAYDIMHTMASVKSNLGSHHRSSRYCKYSAYAWSLTLLCAIPAVVIDQFELLPEPYRPNFGKKRCWLSGTSAFLLYFNGPVGIILLVNCVLFLITARTIINVKNLTAILENKKNKRRFRLYVKLVVVMGLVWITEFIPWWSGIYKLYALAGMLSSLHGVYMFVIFACKVRILKQLKESLSCCECRKMLGPKVARNQSPSLATIVTLTSVIPLN